MKKQTIAEKVAALFSEKKEQPEIEPIFDTVYNGPAPEDFEVLYAGPAYYADYSVTVDGRRNFPLHHGENNYVTIGRLAGECDIFVCDDSNAHTVVSRKHAALEWDCQWNIMDLNSTNGTWLNGKKLNPGEKHPLKDGDVITLAKKVAIVFNEENDYSDLEDDDSGDSPDASYPYTHVVRGGKQR